jgi:hypothetical protein
LLERHRAKVVTVRDHFDIEKIIIEVANDRNRELVCEGEQRGNLWCKAPAYDHDEVEEQYLFQPFVETPIIHVIGFNPSEAKSLHDVIAPVPRAGCLSGAGTDDEQNTEAPM